MMTTNRLETSQDAGYITQEHSINHHIESWAARALHCFIRDGKALLKQTNKKTNLSPTWRDEVAMLPWHGKTRITSSVSSQICTRSSNTDLCFWRSTYYLIFLCYPRRLCRSAWVGFSSLFVCLSVCRPEYNSKPNDLKVFKLGIWNDLEKP